ncbi:TPA: hypothetical protein ACVU5P_004262 [Vibrio parahaemolyticus]
MNQDNSTEKPGNEDVDIVELLTSVRNASDDELVVLSDIAKTIQFIKKQMTLLTATIAKSDKELAKIVKGTSSKEQPKNTKKAPKEQSNNTEIVKFEQNTESTQAAPKEQQKSIKKTPEEPENSHKRTTTETRAGEIELNGTTKRHQNSTKRTTKEHQDNTQTTPVQISVDDSASTAKIEKSITDAMGDFSKFWTDEKGRLRRPDGRYASKDEKKQYQKTAQDVADERKDEKGSKPIIAKIVSGIKSAASTASNATKTDAASAGGAAVGGTYFYAIKEIVDMTKSTYEKIKPTETDNSMFGKAKAFVSKKFGKDKKSKTQQAKAESSQAQQREILQEQTAQQAKDSSTTHKKLDDIVSAIKGVNDDSMLDDVADAVDFLDDALDVADNFSGDSKDKRKQKGNRKGKGPKTKGSKPSRWNKPKSLLQRVKNGPKALIKAGGSKVGGLLKGGMGLGKKMLGSISPKALMKAGGPMAAVFAGANKLFEMQDRDDLTTEQKTAQVATTAAGAGAGTALGTTIGSAIGTLILPGVGTAVGGFIGGALGGGAGAEFGSDIGETFSNFLGSDASLSDYVSDAWTTASDGVSSVVDSVSETTDGVIDKASSIFESAGDVLEDTLLAGLGPLGALASWAMSDDDKDSSDSDRSWWDRMTGNNEPEEAKSIGRPQVKVDHGKSIQEIEDKKALNRRSNSEPPMTVSLDEKSLAALKAVAGNSTYVTSNDSQVTVKSAPASAPSNVPDDFSSRELRRQAADLE